MLTSIAPLHLSPTPTSEAVRRAFEAVTAGRDFARIAAARAEVATAREASEAARAIAQAAERTARARADKNESASVRCAHEALTAAEKEVAKRRAAVGAAIEAATPAIRANLHGPIEQVHTAAIRQLAELRETLRPAQELHAALIGAGVEPPGGVVAVVTLAQHVAALLAAAEARP